MTTNPLLEELRELAALPTTSVALPTLGHWYPDDGSVLMEGADPGDLTVHVLGVIAEQNYKDPFLLLSGEALPKLIKSVCPEINNPDHLAEIDIDAILIAARIVSYGSTMSLEHICTHVVNQIDEEEQNKENPEKEKENSIKTCEHKNSIDVDLYNFVGRYAPMDEEYLKKWVVLLEQFGQKVYLRPMPYHHSISLLRKAVKTQRGMEDLDGVTYEEIFGDPESVTAYSKVAEESAALNVESLVKSIHHVELKRGGSVGEEDVIQEWLLALPSDTVDQIQSILKSLMNDLRELPVIKYQCENCGNVNEIILQMDPQRLFMRAGDSEQLMKPSQPPKTTKSQPRPRTAASRRSPSRITAQSTTKT